MDFAMSDLWNANLLNGINMTEEKEVLEKSMNTKTKMQVLKGKPSITSVQNCATRYTIVPSMLYNYIKHIFSRESETFKTKNRTLVEIESIFY